MGHSGAVRTRAAIGLGILMLAFGRDANAQTWTSTELTPPLYDRGRNVSVLQRERPEYNQLGIIMGGFTLDPKLVTDIGYESNIFANDSHKQGAAVTHINPSLDTISNWGRHQLRASAGLNIRRDIGHSSEDELGWYSRLFGRLDVHGESFLTASADAARQYQERTTPDFPLIAVKPIPYNTAGGTIEGVYQQDRLRASLGGDIHNFTFSNVPIVGGGTLDNSGRDNVFYRGQARFDFALTPDKALFISPDITRTDYQHSGGVFGPSRSSTQYSVLGGATFDVTALMRGEIGIGYASRNYRAIYGHISGLALSSKIEYFPTQLTTFTFQAHRVVNDSVLNGAAGYFDTGASLRVDHELRRNVLINLAGSGDSLDYRGIGRTDRVYGVTGGATYLVSHFVGLNTTISYLQRTSFGPVAAPKYHDVVFGIGLTLQR